MGITAAMWSLMGWAKSSEWTVVQGMKHRDWDEIAYYNFVSQCDQPATLIPEPGNKHDRNAVRVYVHGVHIGYIPRHRSLKISKGKIIKATLKPNKKSPSHPFLALDLCLPPSIATAMTGE